jgi:hypothetical protein
MLRFLDAFFCLIGAHAWIYNQAELDSLRRPLIRSCACCSRQQIREYNGYDRGGFGPWVNL